MTVIRVGSRLKSTTCTTEVVVVRAPSGDAAEISCGGEPMLPFDADVAVQGTGADDGEGTALGKRYVDEELGVELLCTKAGAGRLRVDGRELALKGAKPLPSSD
jgi:hypothetical protein